MALKFNTSVAKGLKLKVRKFWGLIPTFVEVTGKKLVLGGAGGGLFASPIRNKVKGSFKADVGKNPVKRININKSLEIFSTKNITQMTFLTCNNIFVICDFLKDALKSSPNSVGTCRLFASSLSNY